MLMLISDQLEKAGFKRMTAHSLKPKHVAYLLNQWLAAGLSAGTIKNRMACVRWWAERSARRACFPPTTPN
jgi:hypothetical protein